ncbi:hypothetical protein LZ686_16690 [Paracoccus sp. NFXS7]|uniref:hypothetical protein n=1 Tax=Paracoccus sp. NFXS7 TaxID=2908653 RepID=UPI0032DF5E76
MKIDANDPLFTNIISSAATNAVMAYLLSSEYEKREILKNIDTTKNALEKDNTFHFVDLPSSLTLLINTPLQDRQTANKEICEAVGAVVGAAVGAAVGGAIAGSSGALAGAGIGNSLGKTIGAAVGEIMKGKPTNPP